MSTDVVGRPVVPPEPFRRSRCGGTTILIWNVQRAREGRARSQVDWMLKQSADVIVLTEVPRGAVGDLLARLLSGHGFQCALPAPADGDACRVLVAAHVATVRQVALGPDSWRHRCAALRIGLAGDSGLGLVGMYVPSRGPTVRRNEAKRAFQDAVVQWLPDVRRILGSDAPVVIAGDLNVLERDHQPHYRVFGRWEYDFYESFADCAFTDAIRMMNPGISEHSWFGRSRADGTRNGYRFDHAFVSDEHRPCVRSCNYDHLPRHMQLSDHSALILTID